MKIRTKTRLTTEEFPQQKDWIGKLIGPINDFFSETANILNGGMSFKDNSAGVEHEYSFTYQSDAISFPIGFQWTNRTAPRAFQIVAATADGAPVNVSASFEYTQQGLVNLVHAVQFTTAPAIAALTVGVRYVIRVRVAP